MEWPNSGTVYMKWSVLGRCLFVCDRTGPIGTDMFANISRSHFSLGFRKYMGWPNSWNCENDSSVGARCVCRGMNPCFGTYMQASRQPADLQKRQHEISITLSTWKYSKWLMMVEMLLHRNSVEYVRILNSVPTSRYAPELPPRSDEDIISSSLVDCDDWTSIRRIELR
jgi:hypothetical protein